MSDTTVGLSGNGAAATQTTTTAAPKAARGSVTSDPQLVACIKISKTLDSLTPDTRSFVLNYIGDKYIGSK